MNWAALIAAMANLTARGYTFAWSWFALPVPPPQPEFDGDEFAADDAPVLALPWQQRADRVPLAPNLAEQAARADLFDGRGEELNDRTTAYIDVFLADLFANRLPPAIREP